MLWVEQSDIYLGMKIMQRHEVKLPLIVQFQHEIAVAKLLKDKLHDDLKSLEDTELAIYQKSLPTGYSKRAVHKPDASLDNKMAHVDSLIDSFEADLTEFLKTSEVKDFVNNTLNDESILLGLRENLIDGIQKTISSHYLHAVETSSVEDFLDNFEPFVRVDKTLSFDLEQMPIDALMRLANKALLRTKNTDVNAAFLEVSQRNLGITKMHQFNEYIELVKVGGANKAYALKIKSGKEDFLKGSFNLEAASSIKANGALICEAFYQDSQAVIELLISQITAKKEHLEALAAEASAKDEKPLKKMEAVLLDAEHNIKKAQEESAELDDILSELVEFSQKEINSSFYEKDQAAFLLLKTRLFEKVEKIKSANSEAYKMIADAEQLVKTYGNLPKFKEVLTKYQAKEKMFANFKVVAAGWVNSHVWDVTIQQVESKMTSVRQAIQQRSDELDRAIEEHQESLRSRAQFEEKKSRSQALAENYEAVQLACASVSQLFANVKTIVSEINLTLTVPEDASLADLEDRFAKANSQIAELKQAKKTLHETRAHTQLLLRDFHDKLVHSSDIETSLNKKFIRKVTAFGSMSPKYVDASFIKENLRILEERIDVAQKDALKQVIQKGERSAIEIAKKAAINLQNVRDEAQEKLNNELFVLLKSVFNEGNITHFWNKQICWMAKLSNKIFDGAIVHVNQIPYSVPRGVCGARAQLFSLKDITMLTPEELQAIPPENQLTPENQARALKVACDVMRARLNKNGVVQQKPSELLYDAMKKFLDAQGKLCVTPKNLQDFKTFLADSDKFIQLRIDGLARRSPQPSRGLIEA